MGDEDKLTRLIAAVYDAAFDPSLWSHALASIADFVGGRAAVLVVNDASRPHSKLCCHFGIDAAYAGLDARICPWTAWPSFDAERIVSIRDLVPRHEFHRSGFYREWARPRGFVDAAHALIEKSPTSWAYLRVIRGETDGMVDDDVRQRMLLVRGHVRRAVRIGRSDVGQAEASLLARALDCLSAGLFLIDADGLIVHANAAGRAILAADDVLRLSGGRLVSGDAQVDQQLRGTLSAADRRGLAADIKGVALSLTARGGERYVVRALPLEADEPRRMGSARAAVFVQKTALESPSHPEVIATAYRLTPTELRVLLTIVEVGGVPEVAEALGVAESTVKTHIGRLFEKTGARRQADLVKLVAGFSHPLAQ